MVSPHSVRRCADLRATKAKLTPAGRALLVERVREHGRSPAQTAEALGDKWVVTEGLKPGERIIVEGLQRARPGTQVQPQEMAAQPPAQ